MKGLARSRIQYGSDSDRGHAHDRMPNRWLAVVVLDALHREPRISAAGIRHIRTMLRWEACKKPVWNALLDAS